MPARRAYPTRIEAVLREGEEAAVARLLETVASMPEVLQPGVEVDQEGTLTVTLTVHATGLDEAGRIANDAFAEACRQASFPVQGWRIDQDEGPPLPA